MHRHLWQFYAQFVRGYYGRVALGISTAVLQSVMLLPIGAFIRRIFDSAVPAGNMRDLLLMSAGILGLFLAQAVLTLFTRYTILEVTKLSVARLRHALLEHSFRLSRTFYGRADLSRLHDNLVHDTERVDVFANAVLGQVLPSAITVAGFSVVLIYLNPRLFLVLATVTPVLWLMSRTLGNRVRSYIRHYHRTFSNFSKGVLFVLQMMDLARAQAAEDWELDRQRRTVEHLRRTSSQMAWLTTAYRLVQEMVVTIISVVILLLGGQAVGAGAMTMGELLAFYAVVTLMRAPLQGTVQAAPSIMAGAESLQALFNFMQTNSVEPYSGQERIEFRGHLRVEHVHFSYSEDALLEDCSLRLAPGRAVAVAGANGAGKSTLVSLILGFYRPQQGCLLAEDRPYDALDIPHLRRQMGVVMQDPIILPGTIRENLTYGYPEATDAEIASALKAATADGFVEQQPQGLETYVGEGGVLLSGGQRQRLALARALLRRPALLILDEPTNHLDQWAVEQLLRNIKRLPNAPAILMISHSNEVLSEADEVWHLENGRLSPVRLDQGEVTASPEQHYAGD